MDDIEEAAIRSRDIYVADSKCEHTAAKLLHFKVKHYQQNGTLSSNQTTALKRDVLNELRVGVYKIGSLGHLPIFQLLLAERDHMCSSE